MPQLHIEKFGRFIAIFASIAWNVMYAVISDGALFYTLVPVFSIIIALYLTLSKIYVRLSSWQFLLVLLFVWSPVLIVPFGFFIISLSFLFG